MHTPHRAPDGRGGFTQIFSTTGFASATGFPLSLEQAVVSTSTAHTIRGLHYSSALSPRAKYLTCVAGRIVDVVVDVREGSDTFGQHATVELSADNAKSIFVPPGYAHGFLALEDSTVLHLDSEERDPEEEFVLNAFDAALGIDWPIAPAEAHLTPADADAPTLAAATLPHIDDLQETISLWKDMWVIANEQAGA
ncbi:hypothetical protein CAQU_01470 [Corynebacterium aquilae DSM 44791]|uniref:dTDP-4-dehydrorhamnose 3,5-epimerase n=1 Tax=Corynebacterium aquilae DSM 44791 TaxID=1431546 RepID=A0A1L7CDQ7_9CORY|nr:hypothetical protein CAQU_01470 [Corynebacterium aquilae DSM 44791]